MIQNNKLLSHIAWNEKICINKFNRNKNEHEVIGGGESAQVIRPWNHIKEYKERSLVSLSIQIKPLGKVTLTNIGEQEKRVI